MIPRLASDLADDNPPWDGQYFVRTVSGRVLWETARHTSRGGSIRLMRLDNQSLRVYRTYVAPNTPMILVPKTPQILR